MQAIEANVNVMTHIMGVKPRSEADTELFSELYQVLKRYKADDRFGVTLLHKHFDLKDGEILMEYTDEENRIQTIKVENVSEVDFTETIETAWSLKDGKIQMSCRCAKQGDSHNHQHQPLISV